MVAPPPLPSPPPPPPLPPPSPPPNGTLIQEVVDVMVPPLVEQDISCGFALCFVHPIPYRAGQGGKENPLPPPPCGLDGFPLCECIYLPTPPPVEKDGFPFCSETHIYI